MTELDKKERLTKHRCKYDVNHKGITEIIMRFVGATVMTFLNWGHYNQMEGTFSDWLLLIVSILLCVVLVVAGIVGIRSYIIHEKFLFTIIEDKVISTKEIATRRSTLRCIEFSSGTLFTIPHENYTWSEVNKASDIDIFEMTGAGDEFYVVVRKHPFKKGVWVPYMVYNKKFFELSEKSFEKRDGIWYVKR